MQNNPKNNSLPFHGVEPETPNVIRGGYGLNNPMSPAPQTPPAQAPAPQTPPAQAPQKNDTP